MALTTVPITPGTGAPIGVDQIAGTDYQVEKVAFGAAGVVTLVEAANPLPITVVGTPSVTAALSATAGAPVPVEFGVDTTEQFTRAVISCSSSGDNTIVAASAANKAACPACGFAVSVGPGGPKDGVAGRFVR